MYPHNYLKSNNIIHLHIKNHKKTIARNAEIMEYQYIYGMNAKPKKTRFLVTFVTNILIVFIIMLIIWRYDIFTGKNLPGTSSLNSVINNNDTVKEVYHPFTNDVKGSDGELVEHTYYKLSYNEETEQADWVAYMLTSQMLSGDAKRKDNFRSDPEVETESASKYDYKGTKYDRGHLMPAATCKFDQQAMDETFFMSNMSPQYYSFNRGIWKKTEELVRDWTREYGHLFVISGPAAFIPDSVIGENNIAIPSHYYKSILYKQGDVCQSVAFLFENKKHQGNPVEFMVPVDSVEAITGLDFFWELPDAVENKIENSVSPLFTEETIE